MFENSGMINFKKLSVQLFLKSFWKLPFITYFMPLLIECLSIYEAKSRFKITVFKRKQKFFLRNFWVNF